MPLCRDRVVVLVDLARRSDKQALTAVGELVASRPQPADQEHPLPNPGTENFGPPAAIQLSTLEKSCGGKA
jgi:hypothetical protein